ncbi:uncharacterized protein EV420DRAFT_1650498 [Desarmillaria tabescens]|uniref:Uncharacterized protein n=1 Tax=Armillaria tabescens TaxID=1929756 RepID=A0AA39JCY5_ARMTA|nr:uncharacterized protein EV420DRAFT_1650498 [Desarmillaria tabescens]KAK0440481.1 hypothetical protein EV420DRAFT_1650498 [Desarmillaria tabescens]
MDLFPVPPTVVPLPLTMTKYVFPCMDGPDMLDENGNFKTEEIDLSLMHLNVWFVDLCRHYRLSQSGNKTLRQEWLVEFSEAGKENLLTPGHISHKDVRSGGIIKKRKLMQRAHRIHEASMSTSTSQGVPFPVERSKDMCSQMKVDKLIPWAEDFMVLIAEEEKSYHTYLCFHCQFHLTTFSKVQDPFENTGFTQHVISIVMEQLAACQNSSADALSLSSTLSNISCPPMDFDTMPRLTEDSTETFSGEAPLPFVLPSLPPQTMPASTSELDGDASILSDDHAGSQIQCSLVFADGEMLIVRQGDVPPMKPFHYASDIPNLIRSWDDHSPDWAPPPNHPIIINGCSIPIKYWKDLYKYNKQTGSEWQKLKNVWSKWRYFIEAYNASGTPEAFWMKISDSRGQKLPFS